MHQLFQMRTVDRTYFSYRTTDISKMVKSGSLTGTNSKTCEILNSFSDLKEITDNNDIIVTETLNIKNMVMFYILVL